MNNTDPIQDLHNAALDLLEKRIALHNAVLKSKEIRERLEDLCNKMDRQHNKSKA